MVFAVDDLITAHGTEWQFQLANLFDFDWIRKILGKPLAHGYRSVTGFFRDHWFLGFG